MLIRNPSGREYFAENDGEGNQANGGKKAEPPEPETFSKDYVRELRAENKGWRLKAQEAETKAREREEAAAKSKEAADAKIAEREKTAEQRIIRAELKALAVKAGIVDLDGLKLVELDKVKLDDKGEVEGADALIEGLKKAKPYLFTAPGSSSTQPPPGHSENKPKSAMEMDDAEYQKARADAVARR